VGVSVQLSVDMVDRRMDHDPSRIVYIGGIPCSRATREGLAAQMVEDNLAKRAGLLLKPKLVVAANGSTIARYHHQPSYRALLDQADIIDVDGMPLVFASRLFCRRPLTERVATTDFINDACAAAAAAGVRFYFLGARGDRAARAAALLQASYPGLEIVGARDGYFDHTEEADVCAEIVASGADVLWLGMGSPRQESFAVRNRDLLAGLTWIRTCGGLFDFFSQHVPRAPRWMQDAGLEWLFRTLQEPGPLGVRGRNSDNRLIKERLGWAPSQPLRDGLAITYGWVDQQLRRNSK
jgi:N-acetylglucosaminyldiphosphoundecaprenol N-acetyl-beta-D-mannosaminyltransferase